MLHCYVNANCIRNHCNETLHVTNQNNYSIQLQESQMQHLLLEDHLSLVDDERHKDPKNFYRYTLSLILYEQFDDPEFLLKLSDIDVINYIVTTACLHVFQHNVTNHYTFHYIN
jgi:hypothetical protein